MFRFFNRYPWNAVAGLVLVAGILLGLARISPWIPTVLVALVILRLLRDWGMRAIHLRTKGYFGGRYRGGKWVYEERGSNAIRSLILDVENTEPGHYEMFIPSDDKWRASVPEWAQDRRREIANRISERIGRAHV